MLENNIGDLCKCWQVMNNNLKLQLSNIMTSFQKSFYEVENAHTSPYYINMFQSISIASLRRITKEFLMVDYVGTNTQIYGCALRTLCGLPCGCELGRYILVDDLIHIDFVHIHWRKLIMGGQQDVDTDDRS